MAGGRNTPRCIVWILAVRRWTLLRCASGSVQELTLGSSDGKILYGCDLRLGYKCGLPRYLGAAGSSLGCRSHPPLAPGNQPVKPPCGKGTPLHILGLAPAVHAAGAGHWGHEGDFMTDQPSVTPKSLPYGGIIFDDGTV